MSLDLRNRLDAAEAELREAIKAERVGMKGAGMRRLRAEIVVSGARSACNVAALRVRDSFGPEEDGTP